MSTRKAIVDTDTGRPRDETRARILTAALKLLAEAGRDALTTRAVADVAGVQPPVLYRLFGDKNGLLDALAEHGFAAYLRQKQFRQSAGDPIEDLRTGWNLHVDFGLTNPALYLLMYGEPRPGTKSPAAETSYRILRQHIKHVAAAGRLCVSEERAAHFFHASGSGTVLLLLGLPTDKRDMTLSIMAREAALAAITTEHPLSTKSSSVTAAIALRAVLDDTAPLSKGERSLLVEWLDRLAATQI